VSQDLIHSLTNAWQERHDTALPQGLAMDVVATAAAMAAHARDHPVAAALVAAAAPPGGHTSVVGGVAHPWATLPPPVQVGGTVTELRAFIQTPEMAAAWAQHASGMSSNVIVDDTFNLTVFNVKFFAFIATDPISRLNFPIAFGLWLSPGASVTLDEDGVRASPPDDAPKVAYLSWAFEQFRVRGFPTFAVTFFDKDSPSFRARLESAKAELDAFDIVSPTGDVLVHRGLSLFAGTTAVLDAAAEGATPVELAAADVYLATVHATGLPPLSSDARFNPALAGLAAAPLSPGATAAATSAFRPVIIGRFPFLVRGLARRLRDELSTARDASRKAKNMAEFMRVNESLAAYNGVISVEPGSPVFAYVRTCCVQRAFLCLFHMSKALREHVQRKRLITDKQDLAAMFKGIDALMWDGTPSVSLFRDAFAAFKSCWDDRYPQFFSYFEKNWMCDTWLALWAPFGRRATSTLQIHTTNGAEAFFRVIKCVLQLGHTFINFVDVLRLLTGIPGDADSVAHSYVAKLHKRMQSVRDRVEKPLSRARTDALQSAVWHVWNNEPNGGAIISTCTEEGVFTVRPSTSAVRIVPAGEAQREGVPVLLPLPAVVGTPGIDAFEGCGRENAAAVTAATKAAIIAGAADSAAALPVTPDANHTIDRLFEIGAAGTATPSHPRSAFRRSSRSDYTHLRGCTAKTLHALLEFAERTISPSDAESFPFSVAGTRALEAIVDSGHPVLHPSDFHDTRSHRGVPFVSVVYIVQLTGSVRDFVDLYDRAFRGDIRSAQTHAEFDFPFLVFLRSVHRACNGRDHSDSLSVFYVGCEGKEIASTARFHRVMEHTRTGGCTTIRELLWLNGSDGTRRAALPGGVTLRRRFLCIGPGGRPAAEAAEAVLGTLLLAVSGFGPFAAASPHGGGIRFFDESPQCRVEELREARVKEWRGDVASKSLADERHPLLAAWLGTARVLLLNRAVVGPGGVVVPIPASGEPSWTCQFSVMRGGGATASYTVNVFTDGCDCPSPLALCKHVLAARLKYATLFGQDPSRDCELYQLVPNLNKLLGRPTTSSQRAPTGSWARGLSAASATTLREIDAISPGDALRELTVLFDNVSLHGEELLRQLKDNVQEDAGLPGGGQQRSLSRRRALLRLASTAMAANAAIVTEATGRDPIGAVHGTVRQLAATSRDEVATRTAAAPQLRVSLASAGSMQALAASASAAVEGEHAPPAASMPLRPGASVHAPTQHHQSRLGLGPAAQRAHNVTAAVAPATVAAAAAAATVAAASASATTSLGTAGASTTPAAATSPTTVTTALAPPAFVGAPASAASAAVPPVEVTTQVPASAAAAAAAASSMSRKRERDESHGGDGAPSRRVRARQHGAVPESVGSVPLQLPPPPLYAPPPALHAPPPALHAPPPVTPPPPSAAAMAQAQVACIKCSARGAWRDKGDGKVVCICGYVAVWETFEVSAGAYMHDTSCNIVQRLK
jgi:hypothetical protein